MREQASPFPSTQTHSSSTSPLQTSAQGSSTFIPDQTFPCSKRNLLHPSHHTDEFVFPQICCKESVWLNQNNLEPCFPLQKSNLFIKAIAIKYFISRSNIAGMGGGEKKTFKRQTRPESFRLRKQHLKGSKRKRQGVFPQVQGP